MNFDDILSGSNKEQNNYNHKPFNKDEWVKRKNEERKNLYENKAERHIRGGMATKLKYTKKEDEEKQTA